MLKRLSKLAAMSARLSELSLQKEAFIGKALASFGSKALRMAKKNPLSVGVPLGLTGLQAAQMPGQAASTFRQNKMGFRHQASMAVPVPPMGGQ